MNVGRALDELIAERVLKLDVRYRPAEPFVQADGTTAIAPEVRWLPGRSLPAYSRDIESAMEVVTALRQRWARGDDTNEFLTIKDCGPFGWRVEIEFVPDHDAPVVTHSATADTLPHAICLVALKYC